MRKTVKNLADLFQIEPMYKLNCKKNISIPLSNCEDLLEIQKEIVFVLHPIFGGWEWGLQTWSGWCGEWLIGPSCTANPFGRRTLHWNFVQFSFSAFVPHLPVSSFQWPDFLKTYPRTLPRKRLKKQQICGNLPIGTIFNCNCWWEWSMALRCNNCGVLSNFRGDKDTKKQKKDFHFF